MNALDQQHYTATFLVDQTPEEVFNAINNVRGWWSQAIEGDTNRLGAEFTYHYQDVHRSTMKITEFVPGKKVVWHVVDNYFNFVKDKSEWTGTDVVFKIARKDDKTEVHFTHIGLVPAYECYDVCSNAWGSYITGSLRDLIATGKGHPNPIEDVVNQARQMSEQHYTTSFTVDQSPEEVFAAINNVRGWWSEEIDGSTDTLGAEFTVSHEDQHRSIQKITQLVPGEKIVWHVLDSQLTFVKETDEWTGTDIVFEISKKGDRTELHFTHVGLTPVFACYGDCSDAWGFYINDSLFNLITSGTGKPNAS
ncbi:SRPBCC family protein [Dictyobacter aurantiacus]|uniref:Activator of Hsp90 ATPase homologue 1/2-like C-terminal domain-containing protein n=1 Tax=Dictyobacter aurantiacus TaxID=1936993 RepID=A0A401ZIN9_9CHLR|nr:SRPBCC domain-containing protein [Dictyobacter aurantiacus]GCE06712.1 hypothetical protein KDAU_40410 [Dictyobacter aurantiacus]